MLICLLGVGMLLAPCCLAVPCPAALDQEGREGVEGPYGDTTLDPVSRLKLNHMQLIGTHNSYHISPERTIPPLDYTHEPLPVQLAASVRQVELDLHFNESRRGFDVHHLDVYDDQVRGHWMQMVIGL